MKFPFPFCIFYFECQCPVIVLKYEDGGRRVSYTKRFFSSIRMDVICGLLKHINCFINMAAIKLLGKKTHTRTQNRRTAFDPENVFIFCRKFPLVSAFTPSPSPPDPPPLLPRPPVCFRCFCRRSSRSWRRRWWQSWRWWWWPPSEGLESPNLSLVPLGRGLPPGQ